MGILKKAANMAKAAAHKVGWCFSPVKNIEATGSVVVSNAGETFVGGILENASFWETMGGLDESHPEGKYQDASILAYSIASACRGESDFCSIEDYQEAPEFYKALFHGSVPSEPTYRQRLGELAEMPSVEEALWDWNAKNLVKGQIITAENGFYNLDFDVTPTDEGFKVHKEQLGNTYKRTNGYAPMISYFGKEQYIINAELRPGKQHSQKGTAEFLAMTIDYASQIVPRHQILVRMDSGNDAVENHIICLDMGVFFLVKGNRRSIPKETLLDIAKKGTLPENISQPRPGKTVYVGSTWRTLKYKSKTDGMVRETVLRLVYEVTERTIDAKTGQMFLIPDIEANIWWTNTGLSDEDIIERYHQHGGIEQGHAELKTDEDFNKLPSQTYSTNCLMFAIGCIGYNIDHIIGMAMYDDSKECPLRKPAFRRRVKTVIKEIINRSARVIRSGRQWKLNLGGGKDAAEWVHIFKFMHVMFCHY